MGAQPALHPVYSRGQSVASPSVTSAEPPERQHFSHKFWSPELSSLRATYTKAVGNAIFLTIIVMWICLPVYWGSLAHQRSYSHNLNAFFINRDGSVIGSTVQQFVQANIQNTTHYKLGWRIVDSNQYPMEHDVTNAVVEERCWVAVVVNANATSRLNAARISGDSSYHPTSAITIYYAQARNEQAAGNFIVPYSQRLIGQAAAHVGVQSAAQFFSTYAGNTTALQRIASAPQTISQSVWYTTVNLKPFSAPVATALLLVGSIYIIIFSFLVTMVGYGVRKPIEPFLTTKELLLIRIFAPLALYAPLSLSYSMISLCFKVPFQAKYDHAAGFFLYWVYVYLTMASLGLATEFMMQILTPRFMTFFLLPLIISNVSVASLPIQLEPWFYKYGFGFPVYNMSQATRTIIFDTKNHLGLNAGVLIAWIALSVVNITAITILQRRKERRSFDAYKEKLGTAVEGDVA